MKPRLLQMLLSLLVAIAFSIGIPGTGFAADPETSTDEEMSAEEPMSEECKKFAEDPDADLGEVMRAGCEPTLAQMSALMDNPLGNVAMWINQYDGYKMTNDALTNESEYKHNYMGILQFPKGLGKDWNLINRVVYNVTSMPLDQDKIDDAAGGAYGEGSGATLPPTSKSDFLPINLFDGRTIGFGDMYYVGLVAPKTATKLDGGGSFL